MSVQAFELGTLVQLQSTFKNQSGVLTDPTVITFRVRNPSNVVSAYVYGVGSDVVRDSLGVYHISVTVTQSGEWFWGSEASGNIVMRTSGKFYVLPSAVS